MNTKRLKLLAKQYAAPTILIIIAVGQMIRSHVHHLTPWKGGGFGMFSTVDTTGARFLRVYLLTEEGEVPVSVPDHLAQDEDFVRAMPVQRTTVQLAADIADVTWIWLEGQEEEISNPRQTGIDGAPDDESTQADGDTLIVPGDDAQPPDEDSLVALPPEDITPQARIVYGFEPAPPEELIIPFTAVRVEVWSFAFDSANRQVIAQELAEVTVTR